MPSLTPAARRDSESTSKADAPRVPAYLGPSSRRAASAMPLFLERAAIQAKRAGDDDHAPDLGPAEPLPASIADRFGPLLGRDVGGVVAHRDSAASVALGARALTVGSHMAFAPGQYAPGTAAGDRLIAHELAHTVQQRGEAAEPSGGTDARGYEVEADRAADRLVAGRPAGPLSAAPAGRAQLQEAEGSAAASSTAVAEPAAPVRPEDTPLSAEQEDLRRRDGEIVRLLQSMPGFDGAMFIGNAGGMIAAERILPESFPIIRERIIAQHGQRTFDGLYRNDERVMRLITNSSTIVTRLHALLDHYRETEQQVAFDLVWSFIEEYELFYAQAVRLYARHGEAFIAVYELFLDNPADITADDLRREAEHAQATHDEEEARRAAWAEIGERAVGRTIGTREILFWPDDTVTLTRVLDPAYGFETQAEAIAWASLADRACGITDVENRYYVYELSHDYSLSDALATGFERRTGVVTSGSDYVVIVTSDGAVLRPRETRYFAGSQFGSAEEGLEGAARVLEHHGESLTSAQAFRLFRQMVRDLVFLNLARSERELTRELDRFFTVPGVSTFGFLRPSAGEELQRDTAALRRHMMHAITAAETMGEDPPESVRADLRETLAAIGRLHERNPTAALMLRRNRDEEATGPAEESDFEDVVAGQEAGSAAWAGATEIGRRLENIRRVRQHLLENPDAVLDLTPLHAEVLARFSPAQAAGIQADLLFHDLAQLARAIGITVADVAVVITGTIIGGPVGFALTAGSTAFGVHQTVQAFEHVSILESMTELGFTAESALATPEMVSSARMWAWIGLGLTLIDFAGLAGSARNLTRMRSVMTDPDLVRVLTYSRASLREAAEALGTTERALARELQVLRGAERARLIERIRAALDPPSAGGRYGHMNWPPEYTVSVLARMRRALLDDVADLERVAAAMAQFGVPMERNTLALIKRYLFDSPGIAFNRENYVAWTRLSSGTGRLDDVRFLVHEASELAELQRAGFNFLGEGFEGMGRHVRTRWHREFREAYLRAHRVALGSEFDFIVRQVSTITGGRTTITREVAAAVDTSSAGREARELMRVGDVALENHPQFYTWRSHAGDLVPLDAAGRQRLGTALAEGVQTASGYERATRVAAGADPTLAELIAAVKAMRL